MSEACDHHIGVNYSFAEQFSISRISWGPKQPDHPFKHCPECGERLVDRDVEFLRNGARGGICASYGERLLKIADRLEKGLT